MIDTASFNHEDVFFVDLLRNVLQGPPPLCSDDITSLRVLKRCRGLVSDLNRRHVAPIRVRGLDLEVFSRRTDLQYRDAF